MDENLTRGYCQLLSGDTPQTRRRIEIVSSPPAAGRGRYRARSQVLPPLDSCRLIYLALVLCGAGFLLPYNSFITAVDFYQVQLLQTPYTSTGDQSASRLLMRLAPVYQIIGEIPVDIGYSKENLNIHFTNIFAYALSACDRGSVLLSQRCDTLCISGFVDDVMCIPKGRYNTTT